MTSTDTMASIESSVPFTRHRHRTALGITCDILQVCVDAGMDGISITKISQKANLSHNAVMRNCKKLIDAGMIRTSRIKTKYIFATTEKGIKFYQELQKFQDIIREVNIRY